MLGLSILINAPAQPVPGALKIILIVYFRFKVYFLCFLLSLFVINSRRGLASFITERWGAVYVCKCSALHRIIVFCEFIFVQVSFPFCTSMDNRTLVLQQATFLSLVPRFFGIRWTFWRCVKSALGDVLGQKRLMLLCAIQSLLSVFLQTCPPFVFNQAPTGIIVDLQKKFWNKIFAS